MFFSVFSVLNEVFRFNEKSAMKVSNWLFCFLAIFICGLSPLARAEAPIIIKFSHVVSIDSPKGKAAEFFAKRAAELTQNKVKVEVYPDSTLYKDKQEMEALQLGVVQMLAPALSKIAPLGLKEFEVFNLPYIFDSIEKLHRVTQGPIGDSLLASLEPKGIKGLAFWDNGFKSFSANTPLKRPADFNGLRMRIQPSKVIESQMLALGALPQVMVFSEAYAGLKTGVFDGTENPHSNLYTQKMYEVQKYMTLTNHGYLGYAVITNKRFWQSLPTAIRNQLEQAMSESTIYANKIALEENENALAKIRATGKMQIYTPTDSEKAEFKKVMLATHNKLAPRIGQAIISAIYLETGFDQSQLNGGSSK